MRLKIAAPGALKVSEVLQELVAFGGQHVEGAQEELVGRQDAGGLDCEDEMVLALAQLHMLAPLLLPRHPPHLQPRSPILLRLKATNTSFDSCWYSDLHYSTPNQAVHSVEKCKVLIKDQIPFA